MHLKTETGRPEAELVCQRAAITWSLTAALVTWSLMAALVTWSLWPPCSSLVTAFRSQVESRRNDTGTSPSFSSHCLHERWVAGSYWRCPLRGRVLPSLSHGPASPLQPSSRRDQPLLAGREPSNPSGDDNAQRSFWLFQI